MAATDAFTYALREHMSAQGCTRDRFGPQSLMAHLQKTGCAGWVIPAGAKAVPSTAYDFAGTDADPTAVKVITLDTRVSCACGAQVNREVFVEGTFSELLNYLLKIEIPSEVQF